jgi:hypothetical protein
MYKAIAELLNLKKVKGLKMKMLEAAGIFLLLILFLLILSDYEKIPEGS